MVGFVNDVFVDGVRRSAENADAEEDADGMLMASLRVKVRSS